MRTADEWAKSWLWAQQDIGEPTEPNPRFVALFREVQQDVLREAARRREGTPANLIIDDMLEELASPLQECEALGEAVEDDEPEGGESIRG